MAGVARTLRHRPVLAALVLALAVVSGAPRVVAQETAATNASYAFLVRQPVRGRALPLLPANTLEYVEASYDVGGVQIDVFVVPAGTQAAYEDQAAPVDWRNVACNAASLQAFSRAPNTRPLVRVDGAGYTVYISGDIPDSLVCRFSAVFTETFEFFLTALNRDLASGPPPEFPAVLELAS